MLYPASCLHLRTSLWGRLKAAVKYTGPKNRRFSQERYLLKNTVYTSKVAQDSY
jgi:hypothetical protein